MVVFGNGYQYKRDNIVHYSDYGNLIAGISSCNGVVTTYN